MKITVNNLPENIEKEVLTITELLALKRFTFRMLVVKVNGKPIKKEDFDSTYVKDGDNVQIIHLISGG